MRFEEPYFLVDFFAGALVSVFFAGAFLVAILPILPVGFHRNCSGFPATIEGIVSPKIGVKKKASAEVLFC